jgi:protein TonB
MAGVASERVAGAHEDRRPRLRAVSRERRDDDPLAAVLGLGERAARVGAVIGLGLALTTHGALSGKAIASAALRDTRLLVQEMRAQIHDYLWATYEVELPKPPPEAEKPKEPEPPPTPEPEPAPKIPVPTNAPPPKDEPYDPPPAAAEATKILTREPDPNEIVDMTDRGIASGEGAGVGYGQVAGAGTAKAPTFDPNAKVGGVPGGTGTGAPQAPPPPAPAGPDRSRPPQFVGGLSWNNCPFPPEADADQVDQARVMIAVTVRPDGSPLSVKVVSDPGHGFGRAARICALSKRYSPGLDKAGNPITSTTPPFAVRFTR